MELEIRLTAEGTVFTEKCRHMVDFQELSVFCRGMPPIILSQVIHYAKSKVTFARYRLSFGPRGGPKIEQLERFDDDEKEPSTPNPLLEIV